MLTCVVCGFYQVRSAYIYMILYTFFTMFVDLKLVVTLYRDSAGRKDAEIPDVRYALAAFIPMASLTSSTRAGNPHGSRLWPFFFVKFEVIGTPRRKSTHFCLLPPATKLGQGYVFTRVCDSVHGGGPASVHAGILPWE